jgi:hypothetical protein
VLTYNETRLERLLWGTRLRRVMTWLIGLGMVTLASALSRVFALALLALLALAYALSYFLASTPAYRVVERDEPGARRQP